MYEEGGASHRKRVPMGGRERLLKALTSFKPTNRGRGGKWLTEKGFMNLFRSSSLGLFQSSLSAVKLTSKTPNLAAAA